jgi:hypothetical protein
MISGMHASRRPALAPLVLLLPLAAGCAALTEPADPRGLIVGTGDARALAPPAGVQRAVVLEIDGERVATGQRAVPVSVGVHTVRAAPVVAGPSHQVPSAEALATRLSNRTVTIHVTAGARYLIGIRWLQPPDYERGSGAYEAVAFSSGAVSGGVPGQEPP